MSAPRTHALLALLGATSLCDFGCVGDDDGAQPTSSAGSVGTPDTGTYDPVQGTDGGSGSATSGNPGPASGNSDPTADSAETGDPGSGGPGGSAGPTTTGPGSSGGTSMTGGSSGSASTGYASSTGYYGSTGYYDARPEDDGWYTGLGTVECGDIPLRTCP